MSKKIFGDGDVLRCLAKNLIYEIGDDRRYHPKVHCDGCNQNNLCNKFREVIDEKVPQKQIDGL
jgi:hypothetical protein